MRVGGEVMMILHGYTLRTRLEHARRTLGALQIVQHLFSTPIFAGHALEAR